MKTINEFLTKKGLDKEYFEWWKNKIKDGNQ